MRVVFNKLPLLINGMELEKVTKQPPTALELTDQTVVELACPAPCAAPVVQKSLQLTGAPLSPNPLDPRFAYGPAVQMQVLSDTDPLAFLEPASTYQVTVNPGVSGRDGNKVLLDAAAAGLLSFTTEAFQVLRVGVGDSTNDPYVYADPTQGTGAAATPYLIASLPLNGVVAVGVNAGVFEPGFTANTVTATLDNKSVPVKIGLSQLVTDMKGNPACDAARHRSIYLFPGTMDGTWGAAAGTLVLTLHGAEVHDVSQNTGHPVGRHSLPGDVTLNAQLTGAKADPMTYTGLTSDMVSALADCPAH